MYYLYRLYYRIKDFKYKRFVRLTYQKLTKGWSDEDTWSLDHSLAKLILPRLKRFREVTIARPWDINEKEWYDILDQMIFGFEFYAAGKQWESPPKEDYERANNGIKLFAEYYPCLWW